jgi:hypothetical protein
LIRPVALVHVPADRTCLRAVGRIDLDDRDPGPACLVRYEPAELVECPGVQRGPLGLAEPDPAADSLKIFQGDPPAGAFSLGHDALRYAVVSVGGEPPLLPTSPLQQPLGTFGALSLELGAQAPVAVADSVEVLSGMSFTVACGGDVDDAEVDPKPSARADRRGLSNLAGGVQVPPAPSEYEVALSLAADQ